MSYADRSLRLTVPVVRSWVVRAAPVSTTNAAVATAMPATSAAVRPAWCRNRSRMYRLIITSAG